MKLIQSIILAGFAAAAVCSCRNNSSCDTVEAAEPEVISAIRLNVSYTLKDGVNVDEVKAIADSLVAASREDAGCISYDFLESTTTPGEYMIVETWDNDSLLDIHSNAPHFVKYVPQLQELGTMTLQRFAVTD